MNRAKQSGPDRPLACNYINSDRFFFSFLNKIFHFVFRGRQGVYLHFVVAGEELENHSKEDEDNTCQTYETRSSQT